MPGTVNGWTLAYTAIGGVLMMSGITDVSLSATVKDVLAGKAPAQAPDTAAATAGATAATALTGSGSAGFAQSLLSAIGAPATAANVTSIENWIAREGGGGANNPLNTTLVTSGSTGSINSVGVQNYGTSSEGLAATVQTLESGAYGDILLLLRAGKGLVSGAAQGLSRWSGGAYTSV